MKVTIHQPEHLPWLGFFNKMSKADVFIILDNVQFRKNYFQNRNKIMGTNGPQWLTVPVLGRGHMECTIKDMNIVNDNNSKWEKKYFDSIYFSYKKYPYFNEYISFFENLLHKEHNNICELNIEIIMFIANVLNICPTFIKASTLNVIGTNSDLILNLCSAVGAETYISGPSGRDYLKVNDFTQNHIDIIYNDYIHPNYPQKTTSEFVPFLSTIDLLFNVGSETALEIINK